MFDFRVRRRYTASEIDLECGERSLHVSTTEPATRASGGSYDTITLTPSDTDYIEKQILAAGVEIVYP